MLTKRKSKQSYIFCHTLPVLMSQHFAAFIYTVFTECLWFSLSSYCCSYPFPPLLQLFYVFLVHVSHTLLSSSFLTWTAILKITLFTLSLMWRQEIKTFSWIHKKHAYTHTCCFCFHLVDKWVRFDLTFHILVCLF